MASLASFLGDMRSLVKDNFQPGLKELQLLLPSQRCLCAVLLQEGSEYLSRKIMQQERAIGSAMKSISSVCIQCLQASAMLIYAHLVPLPGSS